MTVTAPHTPRRLIGAVLLLPVFVALAVALFAWPAARMEPRDLPIGLVGPAPAIDPLGDRLTGHGFDVHRYDTERSARSAIEDRDVYGAIVATPDRVTLLTASAASPAVAQLLQEVAASLPAAGGNAVASPAIQPKVDDVVPADPDDPRGAVLSFSILPLVLASLLTGVVLAEVSAPGRWQIGGLVSTALLAGLAATAIVQGWLAAIGGNWLVNAGVLSLTVLAIASVIAGTAALFGRGGLVFGALLMVFVGNPWSGVGSAPELMPAVAGVTGQLLPPGAGSTLLRSTAFFDSAGGDAPLMVLLTWAVIGLAAVWLGVLWNQRTPSRGTRRAVPGTIR